MPKQEVILGIDPGIADTGYGIIQNKQGKLSCLAYGSIKTKAKIELAERLETLYQELQKIIKKHHPDLIAIEELFFAKNVKTAMKVGQARGVIILTCVENKLSIDEFTPLQVKQAITGYGRAEKGQVQRMLKILLKISKKITPDDAADALAIALTCGVSLKMRQKISI